jgi:RHS repeat-associated protein
MNLPPVSTATNYNANNQQLTFGTTTETYDLNGNLATTTDAGVTTTYTWNARNQLTGISKTGLTASFTYDSFGRRTGRTVNGVVTNYVYDGLNPVQEKNGATVTANLLTGLGIDEFFTRTDGVGVRSLLPDALGSTVALGDGTGTLQTQYTYEPFGVTTQTGLASTNSYKYTGREDDGLGLSYYRARYYQPRSQRFVAEDPSGLRGGDMNLYGYVKNNPVNMIDPTGLLGCRNCAQVQPLPANSAECDKYGDKLYLGAGLKCFCKCAGNGSWPEQVRGCLACERDNGTDMAEAHGRCYALAGGAGNGLLFTLGRCYLNCVGRF